MKEAIITFRVATTISGNSVAEIKRKFEELGLPKDLYYVEVCSVEDAETHDDLMDIWDDERYLSDLESEVEELFNEHNTDVLSVVDFGIKHDGALITHVTKTENGSLQFWSGNPETDKDAAEIVISNYDEKREAVLMILSYL